MVLKLDRASEFPGGLVKTQASRSHTEFLKDWDISGKFLGDADAVGPWTNPSKKLFQDIINDFVLALFAIQFIHQIQEE